MFTIAAMLVLIAMAGPAKHSLTRSTVAFCSLFMLARAVLADEAPALVSPATDLGLNAYSAFGLAVLGLLAWLVRYAVAFFQAHTQSQLLKSVIGRVCDSILALSRNEDQILRAELAKARDPSSPGGASITTEEFKQIKEAVLEGLKKEYGGMAGLSKFLSILNLDGEGGVTHWLETRIGAALGAIGSSPAGEAPAAPASPAQPAAPFVPR